MLQFPRLLRVNFLFFIFFLVVAPIFLIENVRADVISLNSGGNNEIIINSNPYLDGFFSNISDNASSSSSSNSSSSSSSSGSSGSQITITLSNIEINPSSLNVTMLIDTQTQRVLTVTNLGNSTLSLRASQQNLGSRISFEDGSLLIPGLGFDDLVINFFSLSQPGVYSGKIFIGGHEIPVNLNVKTQFVLFDPNITVFEPKETITKGQNLTTVLKLSPQGNPEEAEITINYTIKDSKGNIVLTEAEQLTAEGEVELTRDFDTSSLNPGDYTITIEVISPDGVTSSTANFKIAGLENVSLGGKIIVLVIMLLLVIGIIVIIYFIWRYRVKARLAATQSESLENTK